MHKENKRLSSFCIVSKPTKTRSMLELLNKLEWLEAKWEFLEECQVHRTS